MYQTDSCEENRNATRIARTLVINSLLRPTSLSNASSCALCACALYSTVSTSSFENCGGGSENVTVPEAEICAEMSPVSICARTNVRQENQEGRDTHHAEDQRANLVLALDAHDARDVAEPERHIRRGELLERPPWRAVDGLRHQAEVPVLQVSTGF